MITSTTPDFDDIDIIIDNEIKASVPLQPLERLIERVVKAQGVGPSGQAIDKVSYYVTSKKTLATLENRNLVHTIKVPPHICREGSIKSFCGALIKTWDHT